VSAGWVKRAFSPDRLIWWVLLASALGRVAALVDKGVMYDGGFSDAIAFMDSARTLLASGHFSFRGTDPSAYVMPGFPAFLAVVMLFASTRFSEYLAVKLAMIVASVISVYLLYVLGRRIGGTHVGLIAAAMLAVSMPSIYTSTLTLSENLYLPLLLGLVLGIMRFADAPGTRPLLLVAVLFCVAVYVRQVAVGVLPAGLVYLVLRGFRWRTLVRYAAVFLAVGLLALAPWWVRNYRAFGEFVPFTSVAGAPFMEGTYQRFDPYDGRAFAEMDRLLEDFSGSEADKGRLFAEAGRQHLASRWREAPADVLVTYLVTKPAATWLLPFYWDTVLAVAGYWVLRIHVIVAILGLSALGWMTLRRGGPQRVEFAFLLMNVVVITLGASYYLGLSRYVYPYVPFMYVALAYAVGRIVSAWRDRRSAVATT
jgi:4-amino-4-deoxy-L-arabinose transferase-like glycosyltransferase